MKISALQEQKKKDEKKMETLSVRITTIQNSKDIIRTINYNISNPTFFNMEMLLLNFERYSVVQEDYVEIQKMLSLIFHSGKTISIHFNNPMLIGSFQYDCANVYNLVIDILFYHQMKDVKESIDILLKNFKVLIKETTSELIFNIINRINETNMDISVKIPNKNYSFRLLIRDEKFRPFITYLKVHNSQVNHQIINPTNFNILRRIFRIWRRNNKLFFLNPELLDWIIRLHTQETLVSSVLKILNKGIKNFKEIFKKIHDVTIPEVILEELEKIKEEEISLITDFMKIALDDISNGGIEKFLNFNLN